MSNQEYLKDVSYFMQLLDNNKIDIVSEDEKEFLNKLLVDNGEVTGRIFDNPFVVFDHNSTLIEFSVSKMLYFKVELPFNSLTIVFSSDKTINVSFKSDIILKILLLLIRTKSRLLYSLE